MLFSLLTPVLFAPETAAVAADGALQAALVRVLEEELRQGVAHMAGPPPRAWTFAWALDFSRAASVLSEPVLAAAVYARAGAGPSLWAALVSGADLVLSWREPFSVLGDSPSEQSVPHFALYSLLRAMMSAYQAGVVLGGGSRSAVDYQLLRGGAAAGCLRVAAAWACTLWAAAAGRQAARSPHDCWREEEYMVKALTGLMGLLAAATLEPRTQHSGSLAAALGVGHAGRHAEAVQTLDALLRVAAQLTPGRLWPGFVAALPANIAEALLHLLPSLNVPASPG